MPAVRWKHGYTWITAALFVGALAGHWAFAWIAYGDEQRAHDEPVEVSGYFVETMRDTLENWQSEFLQLIWQVAGLALLFHVGSPSSKEGDDRKEEKLDALLDKVYGKDESQRIQADLERRYPKS
jgi:hypothetical protein